ncbi:MAG: hypothetical protein ACXVKO_01060 [Bacteriovorax sp.]
MELITLIGADASGKDTQISRLKSHFLNENKKVQVITIWDSLLEFSEIPDKKMVRAVVETFLLKFEPDARSLFLMSCLKNSFSKLDPSNDVVLLNGFFHKYWASEMAYGVESAFWERNREIFSRSGRSFYLKAPLSTCLGRKTEWSSYEQGKGKFQSKESLGLFEFQKKLHQNLDGIVNGLEDVLIIDGSKNEDAVFMDIVNNL